MKYNYTKNKNDYLSPVELVNKALLDFNRDFFDLDVCCSKENIPAIHYYIDGQKDGLSELWRKFNWCNPPFDECKKWIKKAYEEQQRGNTTVMLIPVRTETTYWHDYILYNPKVKINWLKKGYRFTNAETMEQMGIFKNALALVYFIGELKTVA